MRCFSRCNGGVADLRGRGGPVGEHCNRRHCAILMYKTGDCNYNAAEAPDKQGWPCAALLGVMVGKPSCAGGVDRWGSIATGGTVRFSCSRLSLVEMLLLRPLPSRGGHALLF